MAKEVIKRKKTAVIRKSDIKQIIAYPEVTIQETSMFGRKLDNTVEKAKAVIFCETSKDRCYTIYFEDTASMYEWLDDFQKQSNFQRLPPPL